MLAPFDGEPNGTVGLKCTSKTSNGKISGFRMMNDNRRSRLLGLHLVFFGEKYSDSLRFEKLEELCLVLEAGASCIAEAVPGTLIPLTKQPFDLLCIPAGDPEFLPDTFMEQFGHRLGAFNAQAVEIEVVFVLVRIEQAS